MERVALYLRSSKDRHDVSVESQRRELLDDATKRGYVVTAEFVDKVQSAKSDDRPAFQEMIAEAGRRDRRFDIISSYDTSRFARNAYDAKIHKQILRKKLGIRVEFLKLPTSDSYMDPLIESLMEGFDQLHSEKARHDGLRGMKQNVLQGFRAGGRAPLGYKLDKIVVGTREGMPITKSKLVRDPETFSAVRAYLESRASGHGRPAAALSAGLTVPSTSLVGIEDNVLTYAGHTLWNKHNEKVSGGGYRGGKKLRPQEEWVIRRDTHEAMISDEQAESIQGQRKQNGQRQRRARLSPYLLSGLLRCACGANFDGDAGYYKCHDRCGSRSIKKETVEQAVLDTLFTQFLTPDNLAGMRDQLVKLDAKTSANKRTDTEGLQASLAKTSREIDELVTMLTEVVHRRPLLAKIDELEAQRVALVEKLQATAQPVVRDLKKWDEKSLRSFVKRYKSDIEFGDAETKKAILRTLVASAKLDDDDLSLVPNYPTLTGVKVASPRGSDTYMVDEDDEYYRLVSEVSIPFEGTI